MAIDKTWFQMLDVRRRRYKDAVWIPLRVAEHITREGRWGYSGYRYEFFGLGSVAIPLERRADGQKLRWSDIGLMHSQRAWAMGDYYKPVDVYQYHDKTDLGFELVLEQSFDGAEPRVWHLNQDLVFALGLLRVDDEWVCPAEDYVVVARRRRDAKGLPIALEIKNDFLRDYLCARKMFLRLSWFRSRDVIVDELGDAGSPADEQTGTEGDWFELRVMDVMEGGHEGAFAVFSISRTDIDPDEDVPRPGPETEHNTRSETREGRNDGRPLVRVIGEWWRDDDIEPADQSPRVRGDTVPSGIHYIVDASGTIVPSEKLDDEENPQWLWFRPEVVLALIKHRGGGLHWYTEETGGVRCSPGGFTHFGLNKAGLVTVYAYDIVKLPHWQQRLWAGYNAVPDGGVSRELLSAQMKTRPAPTTAPESALPEIMRELDALFIECTSAPLFRPHTATDELVRSISRFRALEPNGLLTLAKDLMRLIADRIDIGPLQKAAPPAKGDKLGSLKSLERYLATRVSPDDARRVVGPLAGAYELRLADAHLPASELESAYKLAGVDPTTTPLEQGFRLIASVASALITIGRIVYGAAGDDAEVSEEG